MTILVDGIEYVNGTEARNMIGPHINDTHIRNWGRDWNRLKVGNRWFYQKDLVAAPILRVANWQRLTVELLEQLNLLSQAECETALSDYYSCRQVLNQYDASCYLSSVGSKRTTQDGIEYEARDAMVFIGVNLFVIAEVVYLGYRATAACEATEASDDVIQLAKIADSLNTVALKSIRTTEAA